MRKCVSWFGLCVLGMGCSVLAQQDGAWDVDADGAWTDWQNWRDALIVNEAGATAWFTNSVTARRTVTVDAPVTVGALRFGSPGGYNNWRLVGEPITLDGGVVEHDGTWLKPRVMSTVNQRVEIFAPLRGENGFFQESSGDIELAGVNTGLVGVAELRANTVSQTMAKTAESADTLARDYFPMDGMIIGGARFELWGRKNGEALSSEWMLEADSAVVTSTTVNAASALAPGQAVSGEGIQAGTFIRQVLDGSNLVLSAAASVSGPVTLSFAAAGFRSEQVLRRVRTDQERDFNLRRNGGLSLTVDVERVYGPANWAIKSGDGAAVVRIPGQREHRASILLHTADLALAPKTVTRQPADGASFHVDASQPDTLTLDGNIVTEWRDVNGVDIAARPPDPGNKPTLMENALNGLPVVDFGQFGNNGAYMHWFNSEGEVVELADVRAVFWVFGSQNGGGYLLGARNVAHFHRGDRPDGAFLPILASSRLQGHDANTFPSQGRVEAYIDGIRRDANAALNGGYQVISYSFSTNGVTAGSFARDRMNWSDRCGGQRLAEVIIYERPLTELERIQTEEYLMAKWFGDTRWDANGGDPAVTQLDAMGTRVVSTPESGTNSIGRLSGAGRLTKTGGSTLALTDAQDYRGTLELAAGDLALKAEAIPDAPAAGAYFHLDASVDGSLIVEGDEVTAWSDWRDNGLAAFPTEGFAAPTIRWEAQNGLSVVDFGAGGSGQALAWNHTNNAIRAAFVVFHNKADSSQLLGSMAGSADFFRANANLYYNDGVPSRAVVFGANRINGWLVEPTLVAPPPEFCVVSVIPTTAARASAFAMDRGNTTMRHGGQRLAEVIIYNHELTDKERRDTEAYLMRKWLGRAAPGYGAAGLQQVPTLAYAAPSLGISVDGDGTAAIGSLTGSGRVVKRGGGTLAFGGAGQGFGGTVEVAEGAVSASAVTAAEPARSPVFHVDASMTDMMELVEENGTNFVARWWSLGSVPNAASERAGLNRPFLREDDLNGMPVVDFGPWGANGASLQWDLAETGVRTAFLVFGSQAGGGFILGATNTAHFHRGPRGGLSVDSGGVDRNNAMFGHDVSANVLNGTVWLDGMRVQAPTSQPLSGGWQLIGIQTAGNTTAGLFASDRSTLSSSQLRYGGQRLAEVIIYDRTLTEIERKQTENYLNEKWFGRGMVTGGLGTVIAADGTGLSAGISPMQVNRLEGEGTVLKTGADVLTLADTRAFTGTVDVAEGTLNLAVPAAPLAPPSGTLFWVDASAPGTIDTDTAGNVTAWRDVTGNGRYAGPFPDRAPRPTLRNGDFSGRPVVDMGPYGTSGACMLWNERITGIKSAAWVLGSQMSGGYLLGGTDGTPFHRGRPPSENTISVATMSHLNLMLSGTWGAVTPASTHTNGIAIDANTTPLSGGWQSIVMTWTSNASWADGFAFDRTNFTDRCGGQRLAEFIAYDHVLDAQERADLDAYINAKWFGVATPGYARPATQTSVILHDGTALTMNGTEQTVNNLSGSGAVSNGTLVVTGMLSPGLAEGDCVTLPVNGNLTLADGASVVMDKDGAAADCVAVSGTLTMGVGGTVVVRLPTGVSFTSGRVALFTFGTLEGAANLVGWTVTGLSDAYSGRLIAEGQTVWLSLAAKGTLLMVR